MSVFRCLGIAAVAAATVAAGSGRAQAFCGFFVAGSNAKLTNNASQVVLMRKGNRTVMTMSNAYQGPPENFAMVVPVPVVLQKENVKTLPTDVFDRVDSLSAPRLVEYWEQDPCSPPREVMKGSVKKKSASAPAVQGRAMEEDLGVTIEAKFVAGEYEILILSATDSSGLETWLRREKYNIPQGASEALAPYIRDKSKFFVARVDIRKVKRDAQGVVQLSPLRFYFDANELRLPVRLGLLNAGGKQDLIVYVIHPTSRFEVANYANSFIPTNLEVADGVRNNFPAFFAELFDATVEKMGRKVVITEYAWQTTGCDPCPTPPLSADDLATLGLDVLEGIGVAVPPGPPNAGKPGAAAPMRRPPPGRFFGGGPSWVLTRLHARYSKETLAEDSDLPRGEGGDGRARELERHQRRRGRDTSPRAASTTSRAATSSATTGRDRSPARARNTTSGADRPATRSARPTPTAAKGLATAPRGKVVLTAEVRSPVPLLGIAGKPPHRRQKGK